MDDKNKSTPQKVRHNVWHFLLLLLAVFGVWGVSWILVARHLPDWQSRSSFGDMFGAVNALFSGAALAGVIYAILLQRQELELQRLELQHTREELRRSAEAQEKSEKSLSDQVALQNRFLTAQVLRDRFETYWKTYTPVTDDQVAELRLNPEDYMDIDKYESSYKDDAEACRRYIMFAQLYEYLAFAYALKLLNLPDPLEYDWTERWAKELTVKKEFCEVHEYYKPYYPKFGAFLDGIIEGRAEP